MPVARFRAVATAVSLVFAIAAAGADETAPVQKPGVKVGDSWRYRATDYPTNVPRVRTTEVRVTFTGPNEILTADRGDRDSVWSSEWAVLSRGGPGVSYDKPRRLLNFPLTVGTSHQITFEVVSKRGTDARARFEETIKVLGWEDVVVPAGKFRALKLEGEGSYQRLDRRGGGWTRREIWYVPEVKRWVKSTYGQGHGAPTSDYQRNSDELVAYKVQ